MKGKLLELELESLKDGHSIKQVLSHINSLSQKNDKTCHLKKKH